MNDENPFLAPQCESEPIDSGDPMTTAEKVYTAFVFISAIFLLMLIATLSIVFVPELVEAGKPIRPMYVGLAVLWIAFATLAVTASLNLYLRELSIVPTVVQIVVLFCTVYCSPIAVWGAALLYFRLKRHRPIS